MNWSKQFARRGPWITQFRIGGKSYGGHYDVGSDPRMAHFCRLFPRPGRVLELGCLEGGHSFLLAQTATEVIAIDAREENLARARWLQESFLVPNVQFRLTNLETDDLREIGRFDVIFNVGLLYHLPAPWELLGRLASITDAMFLWTHIADDRKPLVDRGGYQGMLYAEQGHADPLSGMSPASFWPTEEDLYRMLRDAGFVDIHLLERQDDHPHGPALLIHCRSEAAAAQETQATASEPRRATTGLPSSGR